MALPTHNSLETLVLPPCWGLDIEQQKRTFKPHRNASPAPAEQLGMPPCDCVVSERQESTPRRRAGGLGILVPRSVPGSAKASKEPALAGSQRTEGIGIVGGCPPVSLHITGLSSPAPSSSSSLPQSSSPEKPPLPPGTSGTLTFILSPSPEMLSLPGAAEIVHGRWTTSKPSLCFEMLSRGHRGSITSCATSCLTDAGSLLSSPAQQLPPSCSGLHLRLTGVITATLKAKSSSAAGQQLRCPLHGDRLAGLRTGFSRLHLSELFLFWILMNLN